MKHSRFLWAGHPARALAEAWSIGMLTLFCLSLLEGDASPFVFSNGLLFLCGVCGMWVVLRARIPQGSWLRQGIWEVVVGFSLSLVMALGLRLPATWLGWETVWRASNLGDGLSPGSTPEVALLFLATGPGYLVARAGVRFWLRWNQMRRKRMLWALTHAQLTVVALVAVIGALGLFVLSSLFETLPVAGPESADLLTSFATRLLHTIFPATIALAVLIATVLIALLPPSALVSFLIARRTTRRLERLAAAASALREGNYGARVEVVGEDEVAQMQSGFNAMADDLEQTLRDLQVERDRVGRLLESRRELVASVSHELRTPVATARATLESALSRWPTSLPDNLRHDLEVTDGEIIRLQRLIDDLFVLAAGDAGGLALECQPLDVAPLIQRMVDALAPLAWNSGRVEVVAELPAESPAALADGARLEQILSNLLRNGIRHTPPGGIVGLMVAVEEDAVCIEVRDTGEGIAPEDLPYIWDRFYRGRSSSGVQSEGTGLGLTLVKELTEAMGGTVAVESIVGQGSCFTVRLPKA
jgi:signal transduction histidine kinase